MAFKVTYNNSDGCFESMSDTVEIHKPSHPKAKITIENNGDQILRIHCVVQSAQTGGINPRPIPVGDIDVFEERVLIVHPQDKETFKMKKTIGLGSALGALAFGFFIAEGGCDHRRDGKRGHTDWHINC